MAEAVPSFFGASNMTFFEHMGVMVRKGGRAVDARGRDVYLSNTDRYRMPISLITGEHNRMFLPRGLEATHDLLRAANGPELYTRHVIEGYAHLDLWLGRDAERDVFPIALAELERHAVSQRRAGRPLRLLRRGVPAGPAHAPRGAGRVDRRPTRARTSRRR